MKHVTTIILFAIANATLVAASGVAQSDDRVFDLNGTWRLERTENFEEYLKQSGAAWWKRKLAKLGSSRMTQTIRHEGIRFDIESDNPVETRTESFVADGVTERTVETATGEMMTWTARVEGTALVVDGHGEIGHRTIRREVVEDQMVMTIFNPDANTQCKIFFMRVAAN